MQFEISASSTPNPAITNVVIDVIFSTDRKASNNPAKVASPFALSGNPRCILSDPPTYSPPWYSIGPYGLGINTAHSGSGRFKFEFSFAARITFADGSTKDFGYDPEMDVDV